ncbi:MAG: hypothetical protein AAGU11_20815 [Syntrophobacteraceae bacterium]
MGAVYRIVKRQTTYWDINGPGEDTRVHFIEKLEFHFETGSFDSYSITREHPVLVDYQLPWQSIFVSSSATNPTVILEHMAFTIRDIVGPWRNVGRYLNPEFDPVAILKTGWGLLFEGPISLCSAVAECLDTANVHFSAIPSMPARWPVEAFIAGSSFVVAKAFRLESIS